MKIVEFSTNIMRIMIIGYNNGMKRFYLLFKGQVQGVGFRWTLTNIAHKYDITGFCRNLDNEDVEVEIQGNSDNLDAYLKEVLESKNFIRIDDYSIRQIEIAENETIFDVKY